MTKRPVGLSFLLLALAGTASAQLITIRTLPISVEDQFLIFPSQRAGMAGVGIALPDSLLDPFANPAKGARVRASQFMSAPTFYGVSNGGGGGRTLPLGTFGQYGSWFGGAWAALQQVDAARPSNQIFFDPRTLDVLRSQGSIVDPNGLLNGLDARTHSNQFVFATIGRTLPSAGLSLAGSVSWAGLHAIDGVDLLYTNSMGVRQSGHSMDVRFGALKDLGAGRSIEAVLLYNRFHMTQDATYLDFFWDPGAQQSLQRARVERNLDYTDTWGMHLQFERPLADSVWRLGWIATMNRMSHPKIPNYQVEQIMNIPRDPGDSYAFNLGVGVSKVKDRTTFGLDVIYEPIWSHTWADSPTPVVDILGNTIAPGGMTVENHFRFSNALFRIGVGTDFGGETGRQHALQFGLILRSVSYHMNQFDHVQLSGRKQNESWVEWSPTWGIRLGFTGLDIRYQGRLTNGTGRPGIFQDGRVFVGDAAPTVGGGIIAAPNGPINLTNVQVMTHQFSISLPLR